MVDRIVSLFAERLSPLRYRRKGKRWSITKADLIVSLQLLKSRFGTEYFVDIELTLIGSQKPDVSTRIDYWIDVDKVGISFKEADPFVESKISDFLHIHAIPLVEKLDSDYLRSAEGHKLLEIGYVTEAASNFFRVDDRA
ncbi:DUF4304 domain-containing protein [Curtobacterium sp. MCBA15_001]|uniref:DUF4304 domain-containing protein n=1 Tax=Curtobacterium sp. MCBA15_001 TaxID=1898731 RepID=UPI00111413AD|nr:DUF4304 domain-containing protein [Curtobacterium sp. MCBA15_001]